jgi:ammonia channel protein AmtB
MLAKIFVMTAYVLVMVLLLALALRFFGWGRSQCREVLSAAVCQSAFLAVASVMMFSWGYALVRGVQEIRSRSSGGRQG